MPVTLRNTDILFNDGSTQSSAAGAPTTAQVLNAIAAGSAGAVGTYALLATNNVAGYSFGATRAGAGLIPSTTTGVTSGSVSGTWRCMGFKNADAYGNLSITLWLRIA